MDHHHIHYPSSSTTSNNCSSNFTNPRQSCKKMRLSHSTYKGIVPQPNGRWGAQFYEGNKRVWVGTFDNQELAARAYDSAVIHFRGHQTVTNFPINDYSLDHLEFLKSLSKAQVIDVLRTHTFQDELARFNRTRLPMNTDSDSDPDREWLFEKVVTPSDVGKLHRLVVPTKYARKYLPEIEGEEKGGMILSFVDGKKEKMWRFKYCYWSSSQNYVLTKGWGEFVKDRGLRSGDVVSFYASVGGEEKRFFIDTSSSPSEKPPSSGGSSGGFVDVDVDVDVDDDDDDDMVSFKMLRLFGVDLCPLDQ